jgi:hypothetical protein
VSLGNMTLGNMSLGNMSLGNMSFGNLWFGNLQSRKKRRQPLPTAAVIAADRRRKGWGESTRRKSGSDETIDI